jgi:transaldolase/glucose-6-phosphate isomerase
MSNPLHELAALGQSVWYDNIRRSLIESGELARLVAEDAVTGVTSNPSIFEKAILGSSDYDEQLEALAGGELEPWELYEALALEDIARAADVLRPVWERTQGRDGYVSIEVSPDLADSTEGTVRAARRLHEVLGQPNVMIKVPATSAGIPAIRELVAAGIPVNVTLIFALSAYEEVARAYLAGLEERAARNEDLAVASVASFFVSRVDTKVDRALDSLGRQELRGQAAVANARLAYARFRELFHSERFAQLAALGARPQRPLWASTGTKDPAYSDVMYVEELAGPETVNTMPLQTLVAFRDHGRVENALDDREQEARRTLDDLVDAGVEVDRITAELEEEGVEAFRASFTALLEGIEHRREAVLHRRQHPLEVRLGPLDDTVHARIRRAGEERWLARLWQKDATLWTDDAAQHAGIRERLGWLTVTETMRERVDDLRAFAREVADEGFTCAVLFGMGGSSLAPEVLARTFGRAAGYPELHVLDSTDPEAVARLEQQVPLARTLFLVSSKSGTTVEALSLFHYFWERVPDATGGKGRRFVAITDPGSPLEELAREHGFRAVFANPPDIGGRYSALSYFGLVPAALIGIDVGELLRRAECALHCSTPEVRAERSTGVFLGAVLGEAALAGRDKVTFIAPESYRSFGAWAEQLLAESTGKEGKGIVPVDGEALGPPDVYGDDRLFVHLVEREGGDPDTRAALRALSAVGHPVLTIPLDDPYDLGGQFVLWEIATAVASAILRINAFDQPNVQEAKDATTRLLAEAASGQALPEPDDVVHDDADLGEALDAQLTEAGAGHYVAIQAYLPPTPEVERELRELQRTIRDATRAATTLGFGPRFLHSTGQLHKGGPPSGIFVQLTLRHRHERRIPGEPYGFRTLESAQALGDLQALRERGRPVLRVELSELETGLRAVRAAMQPTMKEVTR